VPHGNDSVDAAHLERPDHSTEVSLERLPAGRPLRVVIPESIPTRNRGEAAILDGIRESLAFCGECELTVFSPPTRIADDEEYANGRYRVVGGLDLFSTETRDRGIPDPHGRLRFYMRLGTLLLFSVVYRLSRRLASLFFKDPLLRAIASADLVVAGHDGMLTPDHFYLALALRVMKKPLALYGGSHGMQGRKKLRIRKYLQYLVNNSILCTVRDQRAKEFFTANDVPPEKVHVFPDPAVLLKPCDDRRGREILQLEGIPAPEQTPLYALIPVRGGVVLSTSFSAEKDMERKHELRVGLWKEIVMHLLKTTNAHLVFLPHCTGPVFRNDDRRMNRDVFEAIPADRDRLSLVDTPYTASELKGVMKLCDFVLGERTHALIGAVSVGTSCIALTTREDLRMHAVIEDGFGRVTYNLNSPDIDKLNELLNMEWNKRRQTAEAMSGKAVDIQREATRAAELLARRLSDALSHTARRSADHV